MDRIEEIREKIGECDDIIIEQLAVRMSHIQEIISYKKATGIPILQPEQEKKQTEALAETAAGSRQRVCSITIFS